MPAVDRMVPMGTNKWARLCQQLYREKQGDKLAESVKARIRGWERDMVLILNIPVVLYKCGGGGFYARASCLVLSDTMWIRLLLFLFLIQWGKLWFRCYSPHFFILMISSLTFQEVCNNPREWQGPWCRAWKDWMENSPKILSLWLKIMACLRFCCLEGDS